jgi:hypothetical protein
VVQNQTFARPMVSLTQTLPPVNRVVITGPPRIFVGTIVTIKGVSDVVLTPQIDPARLSPTNVTAAVRPPMLTIRETQGQGFREIDDEFREATLFAEFRHHHGLLDQRNVRAAIGKACGVADLGR